jgi:hypothetical protein
MGTEGKGLQRELQAGMQRGARPIVGGHGSPGAIQWEALLTLPSSGGNQVRKMKIVNRVEIEGTQYKVRRRAGKLQDNESLAHKVANASYVVRSVQGGNGRYKVAQIQIRGRAKGGQTLDLKSINDGLVRHPVFGNKEHWVDQQVPSGFFTRACEANKDEVLRGIREAAETVAAKLMAI